MRQWLYAAMDYILMDFELEVMDRDLSIRVYSSIHSEREDILRGLERGSDFEFSVGSLVQDHLGIFDFHYIFSYTCPYQPIL